MVDHILSSAPCQSGSERSPRCQSGTRGAVSWGSQSRRRMLRIEQLQPDSMAFQKSQDTAREFMSAVQIVSRPPDHFRIQNRRFQSLSRVSRTHPYHNFVRSNQTEAAWTVLSRGQCEIAGQPPVASHRPKPTDVHHGTVYHRSSKIEDHFIRAERRGLTLLE